MKYDVAARIYDLRVAGKFFYFMKKVVNSGGFLMLPTILEILTITTGYYAYGHYFLKLVEDRQSNLDRARISQLHLMTVASCHIVSVVMILVMDLVKHHITYHTHYISREVFKNEFLQFLPLFKTDDRDRALAEADRRRLGLSVIADDLPRWMQGL